MSGHILFVDDDEDIRQGDVIRRFNSADRISASYGFIITADCDIAQKKTGDRFTWLEVIPAAQYLEEFWATEQFRRIADRNLKTACEGLNSKIKRSELGLSLLDDGALRAWLAEADADAILTAIGGKSDVKLRSQLACIRLALGFDSSGSRVKDLQQAWTLLGRDQKGQQSAIKEAFDPDRGFPDFVLIPELPATDGYGFVILLRAISMIRADGLFRSETEARINGKPEAFHRIGRFTDGLRFSVAQKLAFLFSRIGMPKKFEDACDAATELLVELVYKEAGEKI